MAIGKKERAQLLRRQDLFRLKSSELAAQCQAMGVSGRGNREELMARLAKVINQEEYDYGDKWLGRKS